MVIDGPYDRHQAHHKLAFTHPPCTIGQHQTIKCERASEYRAETGGRRLSPSTTTQ